jgi:hypothetical protein
MWNLESIHKIGELIAAIAVYDQAK